MQEPWAAALAGSRMIAEKLKFLFLFFVLFSICKGAGVLTQTMSDLQSFAS